MLKMAIGVSKILLVVTAATVKHSKQEPELARGQEMNGQCPTAINVANPELVEAVVVNPRDVLVNGQEPRRNLARGRAGER